MINPVFQFSNLKGLDSLVHGISTRSWGNMSQAFDEPAVFTHNRKQFIQSLLPPSISIDPITLVDSFQTHSDHIFSAHKETPLSPQTVDDVDAFVGNASHVVFMIKTADCQPILLFDPCAQVVGLVHSGWRGSLKNIVGKTVQSMVNQFHADPSEIRVGIGPSIGPCCSEFSNPFTELPGWAHSYIEEDKRHVDFWRMTRDQLQAEGVEVSHIEWSHICTVCSGLDYFSYRGDEPDRGRFASMIGFIPNK